MKEHSQNCVHKNTEKISLFYEMIMRLLLSLPVIDSLALVLCDMLASNGS
jgi:hypothetical protein